MKKIFLLILFLGIVTVGQAQNNSDCQKMDFLNDGMDIHAFSFVGKIKEIKILEKHLESDEQQEIITTIKFDNNGRVTEE